MTDMSTNQLPSNLQVLLARLFEFFSEYTAADNEGERAPIHAQILDLFKQLGVVSDSAIVRQAEVMFERITRDPGVRAPREVTPASLARQFMTVRLRDLEGYTKIRLSGPARQMLRVPVIEVAEITNEFDPGQASGSLEVLYKSLGEPPALRADGVEQPRTSVDVIRAFWRNFCSIPPFCSGKEKR
jgi:hypothetical protein